MAPAWAFVTPAGTGDPNVETPAEAASDKISSAKLIRSLSWPTLTARIADVRSRAMPIEASARGRAAGARGLHEIKRDGYRTLREVEAEDLAPSLGRPRLDLSGAGVW